ncbi:related to cell division control protein (Cdc15) [Cephalotrichum gorgonifer]|uniref:Related to cell division control protein (Cdc15) n=1 Tax=Cephalotrichum gorgonifer TaxID=2041049 RepID=A0AAE8MRR7_9PEZI|nr:related to cell division control protein (Cdc15) [Cephalotrichum gorgonifer]
MPAATAEPPSVALSFANNFWGKDDAGVGPLLERMHSAKLTSDELRAFYSARASIEDDYARKLVSLCRKPLGSQEMGSLKISLDTVRAEVEAMARQHQNVAAQMKSELDEPLAAFAGSMKERRKIIQNGIEKLLKTKVQQTQQVHKTRDKYEQECLKIKGYLAQGHMVMGQEERKNKAKLEKTQISLATSNTEYEAAIKALEDTTARWNREWKAAADKFQDLEEERLDFTKSSLWTFANVASAVCVSDDASCEKIRLSLETMDVEQDITNFISERGTGQEIPDAPKYINFCRGDINDTPSEASEDDNYSVAQFPRSINPAFRTSSPQPSVFESHHDPNAALAYDMGLGSANTPGSREVTVTPQKAVAPQKVTPQKMSVSVESEGERQIERRPERQIERQPERQPERQRQEVFHAPSQTRPHGLDVSQYGQVASVPHDPYPMDGMTMLCRPPGTSSDLSSSARPSSRDSRSECSSIPTSFTSQDPPSGQMSPTKQDLVHAADTGKDKRVLKKKSGFFQNHSPFRRKSVKEVQAPAPSNRNTWHPSNNQSNQPGPVQRQQRYEHGQISAGENRSHSPDPIDANASLALGVGPNVLPVSAQDTSRAVTTTRQAQEDDPIALALAELKGVASGKNSSVRVSADYYAGISTPAPGTQPRMANTAVAAAMRGTPPPSYDQQVQRLGVPPSAHTSKAMKQATEKFAGQTRSLFSGSGGHGSQGPPHQSNLGNEIPRAASPAPRRSASPLPAGNQDAYRGSYRAPSPNPSRAGSQDAYRNSYRPVSPNPHRAGSQDTYNRGYRPVSPNPHAQAQRAPSQMSNMQGSAQRAPSQMSIAQGRGSGHHYSGHNSPVDHARSVSPAPFADYARPSSSHTMNDMAVQLAPGGDDGYGSQRGRYGARPGTSSSSRTVGLYEGPGAVQASRQRSKSVADPSRQYARDGRPILHFARALYVYQAAIPEELGFAKGDLLAVLRHQDDGWWEAEVHGGNGRAGLGILRAARDAVTSKTTRRAIVKLALLAGSSLALLFVAIVSTAIFFASYIPDKSLSWPVYLQYGIGDNPFGVAHITPPIPKTQQQYDVSITVTLPESPRNTDRGNFMIALHLLDTDLSAAVDVLEPPEPGRSLVDPKSIIFTTRRPALMPYVDPTVSLARRLAFLPLHLLFPKKGAYSMTVPLAEGVVFSRSSRVPRSIYVELLAGQNLQTYEVSLTMTANLRGLRWILHKYRIISFITLTVGFWSMEMLFAGLALFVLGIFMGAQGHPPPKLEKEEEEEEEEVKDEYEEELRTVELQERVGTLPEIKHEPEHEHEVEKKTKDGPPGLRRRRTSTSIKQEEGETSSFRAKNEVDIKQEPLSD